jgi:hypothetical protein
MTWTSTILPGATATQLTAVHTLAAPDTALIGRHVVQAYLTVPAGVVRSVPATFSVQDPLQMGA